MKNIPELKDYQITPQNWLVFEEVVKLLNPLEQTTRLICGDKYSTMCHVIPAIRSVLDHMKRLEFTSVEARNLRNQLIENITKRFPTVEVNEMYSIATLLNPCYKRAGFSFHSFSKLAEEAIIRELKKHNKSIERQYQICIEPEVEKEFDLLEQINKDVSERAAASDCEVSVESELDMYLASPIEPNKKLDVLEWWHNHRYQYPRLYEVAKRHLIIPASSATSERVFSAAGYLVDKKRNRLGSRNLEMLLTLKFFYMNIFIVMILMFLSIV